MAHSKSTSGSETAQSRSAEAQKADEVQAVGSAKADAGHPVVTEGGEAPAPTDGKGHPKPATSRAEADHSTEAGTSSATAGRSEKKHAFEKAAATKEQAGRGRRKAEGL